MKIVLYGIKLGFDAQAEHKKKSEEDKLFYACRKPIYNPIEELPSNFIAIDFETANNKRCSPCSIGLAVVKEGVIVDYFEQLIKPHRDYSEFDDFNIAIHGITPKRVKNAPEFDVVMEKLFPMIKDNVVVAHNMSFDASVLYRTSKIYGNKIPACKTICSMCISRLSYPGLISHRLNIVCEHIDVDLDHHDACSDAVASAKIILDSRTNHSDSIIKSGYSFGYINNDGHWSPQISRKRKPDTTHLTNVRATKAETESSLEDKDIVFTGVLKSMPRATAFAAVEKAGGRASESINTNTEFLVMGVQDYARFVDGKKSNKTKRAEALRAKGCPIEIISEEDFLKMIDWG